MIALTSSIPESDNSARHAESPHCPLNAFHLHCIVAKRKDSVFSGLLPLQSVSLPKQGGIPPASSTSRAGAWGLCGASLCPPISKPLLLKVQRMPATHNGTAKACLLPAPPLGKSLPRIPGQGCSTLFMPTCFLLSDPQHRCVHPRPQTYQSEKLTLKDTHLYL